MNRLPLVDGSRVVGADGRVVFKDMGHLYELASKLKVLESKVKYYEKELTQLRGARYTLASIAGSGQAVSAAEMQAVKASRTDSTVLIVGETGTGEEVFAHAIHAASQRRSGPVIKLNCAAVPAELLESELFGYEEGAFTGAKLGGRLGKFELAHGGTLFLDEIGDMPPAMQVKLLRVLQEPEVERVGGTGSRPVDIRVIAATAKSLEELVSDGRFRADLYYRINVISIRVPSLRERRGDRQIREHQFHRRGRYQEAESTFSRKRRGQRLCVLLLAHNHNDRSHHVSICGKDKLLDLSGIPHRSGRSRGSWLTVRHRSIQDRYGPGGAGLRR